MEIRAGKFILFLGLFCLVASIGILSLFLSLREEGEEASVFFGVLLLCSFFFGFAVYFLLHYYNHRIILTEKSMVIQNELRRRKEIFLNDISQVTFSKIFQMFIIISKKGKTRISSVHWHFLNVIPEEKFSESLKKYLNEL
ncbi:hypothetical protein EZY14_010305 [Kordia sp. TARA_039_SRF]|nr:hypothetical protein EZY14_010305 [Kordia sp. TARA_039_SRF]